MPQNEYMEKHRKEHGRRLDHEERTRKREARESHAISAKATNLRGFKAKMFQQERHKHKIQLRKQIKALEEKNVKSAADKDPNQPLPSYLLDRNNPEQAKALSSAIKNRRSEKVPHYSPARPLQSEDMFKVVATGKRKNKGWKRMVTKPTFVGPDFTRRPVKMERFIRPMGLRYKKAHVTHPTLAVTTYLPIISVKKNPNQQLYTQLGVLTKGTIIEVNVSELGLTTAGGKVVWGRW
ncbi:ribosomal protein S8e/ribosomal biogenesis NSA2 [Nemania serpens]|nr:ribosomal protein S8e/ribosomal biogenesis NSA2 [Nemania serpens]